MHFSRSAARAALVSAIVACGVTGPLPASEDAKPSDSSGKPTLVDSDDGDAADDASREGDEKTGRVASPAAETRRHKDLKNPVTLNLPGRGQIVVDVSDPQTVELLIESLKQLHVEPLPDLPASKFCVGIMVQNLTPDMRAVLPGEGDRGVMVQQTLPGGPAATAGLEPNDVITHVGDKTIADAAALVSAIDEAGENPIEVHFLRKGEKKSVQLTPLLREKLLPEGKIPQDVLENVAKENKELHDAILKLRKGHKGDGLHPGVMITRMGPGFVAGPGFVPGSGLPADEIARLTRTIDNLTAEVRKLQATVEQLQKQIESTAKK